MVAPIACALAVLVVLLGAYAAVQQRRRAAGRRGRKGHPGLGEDTTLVVTDVEASTVLWEAIDASVMVRGRRGGCLVCVVPREESLSSSVAVCGGMGRQSATAGHVGATVVFTPFDHNEA